MNKETINKIMDKWEQTEAGKTYSCGYGNGAAYSMATMIVENFNLVSESAMSNTDTNDICKAYLMGLFMGDEKAKHKFFDKFYAVYKDKIEVVALPGTEGNNEFMFYVLTDKNVKMVNNMGQYVQFIELYNNEKNAGGLFWNV